MTGTGRPVVRPPRAGDLPAIRAIEEASFSDPWSESFLREEMANDVLRLCLVAEGEEGICGYIMAWRIADQLHVLNIATAPSFRRRGIGQRLLREAVLRAWSEGMGEVTLEVRRGNRTAIRFYAGLGLTEVGVREGYYADNGEDALIMTGSLQEVLDRS